MTNPKKGFIHKASIGFDIKSENDANNLKDEEILNSLKDKVKSLELNKTSSILEEIDIQESYDFNYDNVDVDELIQSAGSSIGMSW